MGNAAPACFPPLDGDHLPVGRGRFQHHKLSLFTHQTSRRQRVIDGRSHVSRHPRRDHRLCCGQAHPAQGRHPHDDDPVLCDTVCLADRRVPNKAAHFISLLNGYRWRGLCSHACRQRGLCQPAHARTDRHHRSGDPRCDSNGPWQQCGRAHQRRPLPGLRLCRPLPHHGWHFADRPSARSATPLCGTLPRKSHGLITPAGVGSRRLDAIISITRRGAGVVERGGLENRCSHYWLPRVRIPPSPLFFWGDLPENLISNQISRIFFRIFIKKK